MLSTRRSVEARYYLSLVVLGFSSGRRVCPAPACVEGEREGGREGGRERERERERERKRDRERERVRKRERERGRAIPFAIA